ncbi:MAG: cyclase family protein [Bacteroidales bacterium]
MIIDLSHPIRNGMPVYPGTEEPLLERPFTIEEHGFREARIRMVSHTGTHMDSPAHMIARGKTLDEYPAGYFIGKAICLPLCEGTPAIKPETIHLLEMVEPDFILFRTGWSKFWGKNEYLGKFPLPDRQSINWITKHGVRGIGIDAISVDPVGAAEFPNHIQLLGAGLVIVENLTNLENLPEDSFTFSCLPLPMEHADGSPVRAVAIVK